MKKTISLLAAALLTLAACDSIETEEYTVYDGAPVSWSAAPAAPEAVQRAYVEKYTGPKCTNCPRADETLDAAHHQYGDRLVVVSINHPTGQGIPYPNEPDMRTDGGTAWDKYFGITFLPSAHLNRTELYSGDISAMIPIIGESIQNAPSAAIGVQATLEGSAVNITADIQLLQASAATLTLTAAIIEDSLVYKQDHYLEGRIDDYVHNHMLRKVITSHWGRDLPGGQTLLRGTLSFTPDADINLDNSHIVVFLSEKATRRVINCASCKIQ